MRMRWIPLRGEKYTIGSDEVTIIEVLEDGKGAFVSILLPSGKLGSVLKDSIPLPVIDTKNYEKF